MKAGTRIRKQPWTDRMRYKIVLPADAESPTSSPTYGGLFDIVSQGKVIQHTIGSRVYYSTEPFTLRYTTGGKIKTRAAGLIVATR